MYNMVTIKLRYGPRLVTSLGGRRLYHADNFSSAAQTETLETELATVFKVFFDA